MVISSALLLIAFAIGEVISGAPDAAHATSKPDNNFFPIMAWDGVPNNPRVLKRMRECGLTVAGFAPPSALDACQAAGLKAIVSDPRVGGYDWHHVDPKLARKQVEELVHQVRHQPAVYGYYLRDEPTASFFPGLATVGGIIKELHPGAWPYINLFPNYAAPNQLEAPSYDAYLEKFIAVCHPPILSYDHYAVLEGGGLRGEYFANLESVRRAAVRHKLPFWQIVLSMGCLSYRIPTETDMRFQIYTSLAYGAHGLAYFKYFTPAEGNFRNGPIDPFGHETTMWPILRRINLQVGKLAPTLLKLTSDRVYHFGTVPAGCTGPDEQSLVKAIAGQMLVGDFTHVDGSRYVMIVNKDFKRSIPCFPQFRKPVSKLEFVSPYNGTLGTYAGEYVWLAPGQGVLLKLTQ
ncbi:MAG TPA: hypothetical protein VFW73_02160 [Lacipirellulaceae bacterium]|nr:hypothetical protein [Lacipirellulaceae bacterium]